MKLDTDVTSHSCGKSLHDDCDWENCGCTCHKPNLFTTFGDFLDRTETVHFDERNITVNRPPLTRHIYPETPAHVYTYPTTFRLDATPTETNETFWHDLGTTTRMTID